MKGLLNKLLRTLLGKLWLTITSLVLVIILIIWVFQVGLLEQFYIAERKEILLYEGKEIASLILETSDKEININQDIIDKIDEFGTSYNVRVTILDSENNIFLLHPERPIPKPKDLSDKDLTDRNLFRLNKDFFESIESDFTKTETYIKSFDNPKTNYSFIIANIPINNDGNIIGTVVLTSAVAPIQETTSILRKQLSIITIFSLIIATLLAFILAKIFIKPIVSITETSKKIAKGDFTASVVINSKDEIGVLGHTINDMAIQLGQIEKFRKEFIANTSHELKTPLSLIRAYAELIMDIDEDKIERDTHLQVIINESIRLNNMVEDILYLSQMESGYYKLKLEEFSVVDIINSVMEKLSLFAIDKNVKLKLQTNDENTLITGDREKLYQVFFNLINNSIIHSFENEKVDINVNKDNNKVRIEIKDNGSGIPKEGLPYVWDRFYKVDKSRKRNDSGTGLGMSIVKNILESHKFKYGIESELNKGTLVWIEIK